MKRKRLISRASFGVIFVVVLAALVTAANGESSTSRQSAPTRAPHWGEGGVPEFKLDPSWPRVPSKWEMGSASDVTADRDGNIWILSRPRTVPKPFTPAPPVMEFDQKGNFIRGWGGESGPGYQWPSTEHGIFVDYKGYVWVIGAFPADVNVNVHRDRSLPNDNQILKFTKDGKFVMAIGKSGQNGSNSTEVLGAPTDMFVYPKTNELFVSDGYINSRIMVYDADTGKFKRMWGAYGHTPLDRDQRPQSAPLTLDPWHRVAEVLQQFGSPVHDVKVSRDGLVYVADRGNRRIQVFTLQGKFLSEQFIGLDRSGPASGSGIAFSPDQGFMYVSGSGLIWILNRRTLEILGSFITAPSYYHIGPPGAETPGHLIGADNKGNLYAVSVHVDQRVPHVPAYKYAFDGYSPRHPCPPCDSPRTDLK